MTPRQARRIKRASSKGKPLQFIRARALSAKFAKVMNAAVDSWVSGVMGYKDAIRSVGQSMIYDGIMRPMIAKMVRELTIENK